MFHKTKSPKSNKTDEDFPQVQEQLRELGINVSLTANEDGTWRMAANGKEDTGNSADPNTIISCAKRLTNYQEPL